MSMFGDLELPQMRYNSEGKLVANNQDRGLIAEALFAPNDVPMPHNTENEFQFRHSGRDKMNADEGPEAVETPSQKGAAAAAAVEHTELGAEEFAGKSLEQNQTQTDQGAPGPSFGAEQVAASSVEASNIQMSGAEGAEPWQASSLNADNIEQQTERQDPQQVGMSGSAQEGAGGEQEGAGVEEEEAGGEQEEAGGEQEEAGGAQTLEPYSGGYDSYASDFEGYQSLKSLTAQQDNPEATAPDLSPFHDEAGSIPIMSSQPTTPAAASPGYTHADSISSRQSEPAAPAAASPGLSDLYDDLGSLLSESQPSTPAAANPGTMNDFFTNVGSTSSKRLEPSTPGLASPYPDGGSILSESQPNTPVTPVSARANSLRSETAGASQVPQPQPPSAPRSRSVRRSMSLVSSASSAASSVKGTPNLNEVNYAPSIATSRAGSMQRSNISMGPPVAVKSSVSVDDYQKEPVQATPVSAVDRWEGEMRPFPSRSPSVRAGRGGGMRPSSAVPSERQRVVYSQPQYEEEAEQEAMTGFEALTQRNPYTWTVSDVGDWVDYISLGQYRRKFVHHQVSGPLLMRMLKEPGLLAEMGITILAHKVMILEAIKGLYAAWGGAPVARGPSFPGSERHTIGGAPPQRPTSAYVPASNRGGGSVAGRIRPFSASCAAMSRGSHVEPQDPASKAAILDLRSRLMFELQRAERRADTRRMQGGALSPACLTAEEEARHLRRLLGDLEAKHESWMDPLPADVGTSRPQSATRPSSAVRPSSAMRPTSAISARTSRPASARAGRQNATSGQEFTFRPTINPMSRKILGNSESGPGFLDRLKNDIGRRKKDKQELEKKYYSPETMYGDSQIVKRQMDKDKKFLKDVLSSHFKTSIGDSQEENDEAIDSVFDEQERALRDAGVLEPQWEAVKAAKGEKKIQLAAGALRTLLFMRRYSAELRHRGENVKGLRSKYYRAIMDGSLKHDDRTAALQYFSLLGWKTDDEEACQSLVKALVKRAQAYKHLVDSWKDSNRDRVLHGTAGPPPDPTAIDWSQSQWAMDGLGRLMAAAIADAQAAIQAGRPLKASPLVKTPHAPSGNITVSDNEALQDHLLNSVRLLGGLRDDDLRKVEEQGTLLAAYRAVRTQKFIEFTQTDIKSRNEWLQGAYESSEPLRYTADSACIPEFMDRLSDDLARRHAHMEKLRMDRMQKQAEIVASSSMYNSRMRRPFSAKI